MDASNQGGRLRHHPKVGESQARRTRRERSAGAKDKPRSGILPHHTPLPSEHRTLEAPVTLDAVVVSHQSGSRGVTLSPTTNCENRTESLISSVISPDQEKIK